MLGMNGMSFDVVGMFEHCSKFIYIDINKLIIT